MPLCFEHIAPPPSVSELAFASASASPRGPWPREVEADKSARARYRVIGSGDVFDIGLCLLLRREGEMSMRARRKLIAWGDCARCRVCDCASLAAGRWHWDAGCLTGNTAATGLAFVAADLLTGRSQNADHCGVDTTVTVIFGAV